MTADAEAPVPLAILDLLQVEVISDHVSDTYVSKTSFEVSKFANVVLGEAKVIFGETLLVANLGYGLRLRSRIGDTEHVLLFDTGTEDRGRCSLEADDQVDQGPARRPNCLVLIGRVLDIAALRWRLTDCLADAISG